MYVMKSNSFWPVIKRRQEDRRKGRNGSEKATKRDE